MRQCFRLQIYPGVFLNCYVEADSLLQELEDLQHKSRDFRKPFAEIAEVMRQSFRENFLSQGRPSWQPLSTGTVAARRTQVRFSRMMVARLRRGSSVLVDSGAMMSSFTTKGAYNNVEEITNTSVTVGSSDPKAIFHQEGTGIHGPSGKAYMIRPRRGGALRFMTPNGPAFAKSVVHPGVAKRPIAVIQPDDEARVNEILSRYLEE